MDSVICLNVLEHVEDDMLGLRNIHSVLKPGGRAIMLVPHGQEIFGTLDVALGHFRRYSHAELQDQDGAGGIPGGAHPRFQPHLAPAVVCQRTHPEADHAGTGQMKVFDRFVWLWRRLDAYLPWPPTSIIAIGVKPE